MMYIIFASVLTIGTLAFKLINNVMRWRKGDYNIKHGKEWLLMAIGNVPSILMFSLKRLDLGALSAFMVFFFLWLMFDGLYNVGRKFNFWWLGTDDGKKDAFSDRLLRRLPFWLQVLVKLGGFLTFLILYIIWLTK